jgi:cytochrome P450
MSPDMQTSHATQWALYLLARSPQSQEKLFQETQRVLSGNPDGQITEEHLSDMPFVKGVIKESLRLYPVAPFLSRVLDKDITLNGFKVPKGVSYFDKNMFYAC